MTTDADVLDYYARAGAVFVAAVEAVPEEGWSAPTPCSEWDVRDLVNHVVGEDRWVSPLVAGRTIADVGEALDGDVLGADPGGAATVAAAEALAALSDPGALARTVQLSFGAFTAEAYAWQVLADHLVHAWDLLAAADADRSLPAPLVSAVSAWWGDWEDGYRAAGAIGPVFDAPPGGSAQDRLIASFGRDPDWRH